MSVDRLLFPALLMFMLMLSMRAGQGLRWLNTVFDSCVSFTFFSKTLDPLVAKNGSKQVNNTTFHFLG